MKKLIAVTFIFLSLPLFAQDKYSIGDHELIIQPTAYTMPEGSSYFTDYEAVLLNYVYALTDRTHIGIFTLFPVTTDFIKSVTIGVKQNYFRGEIVQAAALGSWTPDSGMYFLGNVISVGKPCNGIHFSLSYSNSYKKDNASDWIYGVGYRYDFTESFGVLTEYQVVESFDSGSLFIAVRFHYEHTSWEIGGFRPLEEEKYLDLILFPFIKGTYFFN